MNFEKKSNETESTPKTILVTIKEILDALVRFIIFVIGGLSLATFLLERIAGFLT
ncbi:MAG: hypothetical protein FWG64_10055 [Firmicutes bacterium]|nr:hypothetical protein [Bacillota bacterium]